MAVGRRAPRRVPTAAWLAALCLLAAPVTALAQCPEEPPIQNYTGAGQTVCPCFIPGEQAGVVLTAPPAHYPLEVLRVGIAWGSQFGGAPQSLEQALHVYAGGLPNPGAPIFTLPGPLMNDGFINQFDLEPFPGEITVQSGPFTVSLEFQNQNSGNIFAPSVVHDGNGCQPGKNVVLANPGGWADACALGVTGDWVMFAVYRPCVPTTDVGDVPQVVMSRPLFLMPPRPNPARGAVELEFGIAGAGPVRITVYDAAGRRVAEPLDAARAAGFHRLAWDRRGIDGARVPAGAYFVEVRAAGERAQRTLLLVD